MSNSAYLLARPPPGGRGGMPLSVDRFLITVTRSGNPSSPGRDSISKTAADMLLHKSVLKELMIAMNICAKTGGRAEQQKDRDQNLTNEEKGSEDGKHTSQFVEASVFLRRGEGERW